MGVSPRAVWVAIFGLCKGAEERQFAGMSADVSTQLILLTGIFGVLVVMLVVLGSMSRSLLRLERRMGQQEVAKPVPATGSVTSTRKISHRADFLFFLSEDPLRRTLSKREQFAAYRKWRKEKGLSWPLTPENRSDA